MKIEYLHASKYGNGAMVAEEFSKQVAGLVEVAEGNVRVTDAKGPLKEAGSTRWRPLPPASRSKADSSSWAHSRQC